MSHIIFLHGASSSGKSTTARALQQRIELPFWHISIDHLRESGVLPLTRYRNKEFDWRADRSAVFDGFHQSLAGYAAAGNNLIVEHILDTPGWVEDLHRLLRPFDVLFVAVHCPVAELNARERLRGDRPIGSAAQDHSEIHAGRVYDMEINSTVGVEFNVQTILQVWRSNLRQSEFTRSKE
ncbi:chloramphenicol phosphotransferase CPT family protein [Ruegeria sp. 6PALISEP08]|uniref:chloramphenicol phosphotransferase CPT family protein n=1 Tax=Ruegeria sp. 6PALISEP08 TaxID=1225660 RepID=UPI00067F4FF7|nr:AAA family ATPase [Ruegeria sp. 6PALISEP08]